MLEMNLGFFFFNATKKLDVDPRMDDDASPMSSYRGM